MSENPKITVGLIGSRGMVGSVLLARMIEESDLSLAGVEYILFSTTQKGNPSPIQQENVHASIQDAHDLTLLQKTDILVTCQGSDYTQEIQPKLRQKNWSGYWIDAASHLRYQTTSTLILDPINSSLIDQRIREGCLDYIGANCTVSLMMLACQSLFAKDLIDWLWATSYQSASGAGAQGMRELMRQTELVADLQTKTHDLPILDQVAQTGDALRQNAQAPFASALCYNVVPWIDSSIPETGQSREEWKAEQECNAILGHRDTPVAIEGVCVRVPVMRCHSQALLIHLREAMSLEKIRTLLAESEWVDLLDNLPEPTTQDLHPLAVNNSLRIKVGRVRMPKLGGQAGHYVQIFTVGDQLLWGAAEPLRRMLRRILKQKFSL